jgi:hypothetical protein
MEINLTGVLSDPLAFPALSGVRRLYVSGSGLTGFDCATVLPSMAPDAFPHLRLSGASIASFDCSGAVAFRSLTLSDTAVPVVNLPVLTTADILTIGGNSAVTSVRAPALTSSDIMIVGTPELDELVLSSLESSDRFTVAGTGLPSLALPALREAGRVFLGGSGVTSSSFPLLENVEQIYLSGETAAEVSFPSLTIGTLIVGGNPGLVRMHLPALASLRSPELGWGEEAVVIRENPLLAEVSIGLTGEVDEKIYVARNPELSSLVLGPMTYLGRLTLEANPKLVSVNLPIADLQELRLSNGTLLMPPGSRAFSVSVSEEDASNWSTPHSVTIQGLTTVEYVNVTNTETLVSATLPDVISANFVQVHTNSVLTTLELPALGPAVGSLYFLKNALLTRPAMPVLTSANSLYAHGNVSWPQCDIDAWASSLGVTCDCAENGACLP